MGARLSSLRDPAVLVLGALATHRITRLITTDEVTRPWRERVEQTDPEGRLAYFVTCPWCVSMWAGAGWAALTVAAPTVAAAAGAALAWSSVTGLLASAE
jgi:hypothetical protein